MTHTATYTLIQRDQHGDAVNAISGLSEASANDLADVLRRGDAYDGERPWTCEVVREQTPVEQLATIVDKWLANGESLTRADHLVECLRHAADRLEVLGDMQIPRTGLKVELHLFSSDGSNEKRTAALDELAAAFGRKGELNEAGHYHTGYSHGGGVRMVTIVEPKPEPKPLVSDGTIRQAEWIGKRYPDGVNYVEPCDDCESNGYNCSAHRGGVVMTRQELARRLAELEADTARCKRRCAALGWGEVELAKLMSGADFRDILRGEGGAR